MSPLPSPDTKAIVRAAEALTTEVRRIADALTTPVTTPSTGEPEPLQLHAQEDGPIVDSAARDRFIEVLRSRRMVRPGEEWVIDVNLRSYAAEVAQQHGADMRRVTALYESWVKAGPPPIGTSLARWWDARLVELRAAVHPPEES